MGQGACKLVFESCTNAALTHDQTAEDRWREIHLRISGRTHFSILQGEKESIALFVDGVELCWIRERVYLVCDPLDTRGTSTGEWSDTLLERSRFFVGGEVCYWDFADPEEMA